ncbi:BLUF domain-containing protein [Robiginitalea sp. IMCC44478]|uniref:BLUF domain-containing protein n=1 Tax=Robiginitalea sp. IMCC44478 TaxID=3459122 RepID=UPI0040418BB0
MAYQITYRSLAKKDIRPEDIDEILRISKKKNSLRGITGCLVFNQGYFIQILEGSEKYVREVYTTIKLDPRHSLVEILSEGEIEERLFDKWEMAYVNLSGGIETEKEQAIATSVAEIDAHSGKFRHTTKVFWYNVYSLFQEKGFYRS